MKYKRAYFQILKNRIEQPRKFVQAVTGPRQVGKTTLIHQLCHETTIPYHYVTVDNVPAADDIWIEQQWETARIQLKNSNFNEFLLIIDEIQKVKNWSEIVKKLWDTDSFNNINLKVILLGSSGLMVQKGLHESFAGRFELIKIPHWSFSEMNECFGMNEEQYAWFGGYPGAFSLINEEDRWKEYIKNALIEATLSKDILMMSQINKPALLRQVFEMGVHYTAQILSYTKMLGQLQEAGNTTTIAHYLHVLDTAGLITGIPKYFKEKYREKASSPKWQVKNTAFISALSHQYFDEIQKDFVKWGQIVESAIGAHLINRADEGNYKVYYWRHRNEEVDFVLQKGDKVIGIEVKSGQSRPTKGMATFKAKYTPDKLLLVGTSGLPWQEFLKLNPETLFD
jgi:predicted AAA+ superfamily ATPase